MTALTKRIFVLTAGSICILSTLACITNNVFFHFPGNNYFPKDALLVAILLPILLIGCCLQFGKTSLYSQIAQEIIYLFLVMSVIALATNAIQYTPFKPIDQHITQLDSTLHIDIKKIMAWTAEHHWLKKILSIIYDSLPYQMSFIPILVIATRQFALIREYYCLLLLSTLIGFSFYYFLPTMGPASLLESPYFTTAQYATGIKFTEIHHYKQPSTLEGGMIALPSFHVIWAWLCLYLVRRWRLIFMFLLPINVLLMASCILLGWHYPVDLLGSFLVLLLTHALGARGLKAPLSDSRGSDAYF